MKKLIALLLMTNIACQNDNKSASKNNSIPVKDSINAPVISDNKRVIKKELTAESVIDSVENRIYNLNKVQALNKQSKVSILMQEPSGADENYTFKVGFNRPDRFETVFNFSFNKEQSIIFYYDVVNDELVNCDKWDAE